jgi:branched-chain amino acid transport system permease protein
MSESVLVVEGVSKRFGAVSVLSGVSLALDAGRVHALIGPNGAGKTTLLNVISGYMAADHGTIVLGGRRIDRWPASRRVAVGMARTFQIVQLFGRMTVLENVLCGFHLRVRQRWWSGVVGGRAFTAEERRLRADARELLARVGLEAEADAVAGVLPFGLQRRLEVARALATRPTLLLLDEPCAGLSGPEAAALGALLHRVAAEGTSVLVVEHNMPFVLGLATHVVVLDASEVIAAGPPERVRTDPRVIAAYLGDTEEAARA